MNDTEFLSLFIDRNYPSLNYDRLDISNEDGGTIVPKESEKIRRFSESRNDYRVLIKSEGGDENLISVLGSKLPELLGSNFELFILIDLDGEDINSRITQFEDELETHTPGKSYSLSCEEEILSTHFLETHVIKVECGSRYVGEFKMIAFCEDLEDAANITGNEADRDEVENKIDDILERSQITTPIKVAFAD
ncbi:hypothetical protein [Halorubrum ezzemoulense]|uniref:hypothetical protein n=1 Tax=Halorubrum ezzemoulense TaxID=337243 RepID=UPI001179CBA5|nr:hypothetical protein [Halorubrum ezzemoulense]